MRTRIKVVGVGALAAVTVLLVGAAVMKPSLERVDSQRSQTSFTFAAPTATGTPTPSSVPTRSSASPTGTPSVATVRFAAVGDAITLADSTDFAAGQSGALSWVTYAAGPNLLFAGGWAAAGATTAKIAANVKPLDVDVLAIVAGTNDITQGVPFAQTAANLDKIVGMVGARRVVLSAIPPRDTDPRSATEFNASLRTLAAQRQWTFVDAPAGVRGGEVYAAGMTLDGVRPTKDAAQIIGKAVAAAIPG